MGKSRGLWIVLAALAGLTPQAAFADDGTGSESTPCSRESVMIPYPGPSIVFVDKATGRRFPPDDGRKGQPTGIAFQVPLDCEGKVVRPASLAQLARFIGEGLSLDDMLAMGAAEGMVPRHFAKREWGIEESVAFQRFIFGVFRLGEGPIAERFNCASGGEFDMSAIQLVALRENLIGRSDERGEPYLPEPGPDGPNPSQLFNFAYKIMWLCDGSPED